MRIRTKKGFSKKKGGFLVASAIVVGVVGYGAYSAYYHQWPFADNTSSVLDSSSSTDDKSGSSDTTTQPGKITSPKTPVDSSPSSDSTSSNTYNELGVSITYVGKTNDKVRVNTLIEAVTNKGTCVLKLTKDGKVIQKTAGLQPLASSSTCKGFDIPTSELSNGTWAISLTVTTGNLSGTATSKVTIP